MKYTYIPTSSFIVYIILINLKIIASNITVMYINWYRNDIPNRGVKKFTQHFLWHAVGSMDGES